jgi:hypothetical protein
MGQTSYRTAPPRNKIKGPKSHYSASGRLLRMTYQLTLALLQREKRISTLAFRLSACQSLSPSSTRTGLLSGRLACPIRFAVSYLVNRVHRKSFTNTSLPQISILSNQSLPVFIPAEKPLETYSPGKFYKVSPAGVLLPLTGSSLQNKGQLSSGPAPEDFCSTLHSVDCPSKG